MKRLLLITIPFLVWTSAPRLGDHQFYTIEVRAGESVEEEAEAVSVESVEDAGAEVDEAVDDIDEDLHRGETSS